MAAVRTAVALVLLICLIVSRMLASTDMAHWLSQTDVAKIFQCFGHDRIHALCKPPTDVEMRRDARIWSHARAALSSHQAHAKHKHSTLSQRNLLRTELRDALASALARHQAIEPPPFANYSKRLLIDYFMSAVLVDQCSRTQALVGRAQLDRSRFRLQDRFQRVDYEDGSDGMAAAVGADLPATRAPDARQQQLRRRRRSDGRRTANEQQRSTSLINDISAEATCGSVDGFNSSHLPYRWLPGLLVRPTPRELLRHAPRLEVMHTFDGWSGPTWLYTAPGSGVWWSPGRRLVCRNLIDAVLKLHPIEHVVAHLESIVDPTRIWSEGVATREEASGRQLIPGNGTSSHEQQFHLHRTGHQLQWHAPQRPQSRLSHHERQRRFSQLCEALRWRAAFGPNETWPSILRRGAAGEPGYAYFAMAGVVFRELLSPQPAGIDSIVLAEQMHVFPRDHRAEWLRELEGLVAHGMLSPWPARLVWPCGSQKLLKELTSHIWWIPEIIDFRAVGETVGVGTWQEQTWEEQLAQHLSADRNGRQACAINPSFAKHLCTSCSERVHVLCECGLLGAKLGESLAGDRFDVRRAHSCCSRTLKRPPRRPGRDAIAHALKLAEAPGNEVVLQTRTATRHVARAIRDRFGADALPPVNTTKVELVGRLMDLMSHARRVRFWRAACKGDKQLFMAPLVDKPITRHELADLLIARFVQVATGAEEPLLRQSPPPLSEASARRVWLAWPSCQNTSDVGAGHSHQHQLSVTDVDATESAGLETGTSRPDRLWTRYSRTNCYEGHGASKARHPPVTIERAEWGSDGGASACTKRCQQQRDCTAVVVSNAEGQKAQRTGVIYCSFHANVTIAQCSRDFRFDTMRPPPRESQVTSTRHQQRHFHALGSRPHRLWTHYSRTNCYEGHGASKARHPPVTIERAEWGSDGGIRACILRCQQQRDCAAVVVSNADGRKAQRIGVVECFFHASVMIAQCSRDHRFDTLLVDACTSRRRVWESTALAAMGFVRDALHSHTKAALVDALLHALSGSTASSLQPVL